jgi:hypothetical protein
LRFCEIPRCHVVRFLWIFRARQRSTARAFSPNMAWQDMVSHRIFTRRCSSANHWVTLSFRFGGGLGHYGRFAWVVLKSITVHVLSR